MKGKHHKKIIITITILISLMFFVNVVGRPISWTEHKIVGNLPGAINVKIGDVDQDGYNDIIAVGRNQVSSYIAWYKNNSDYTAWTEYKVYTIAGNRMLRVADFDGDGDLDFCVSNYDNDRIDVYECPADPTSVPWTRHVVTTTAVDPGYVIWIADFDNDDDIDIYGASPYGSRFYWFRNDGGFSFTTYKVADVAGARGCAICDFDNDGDIDVTGASGSGSYAIKWYENDIEGEQILIGIQLLYQVEF